MRLAFALLLLIHGLIHWMGFAKAFDLAKLDALTVPISKPMGLLWLAGGLALPLAAGLFWLRIEAWGWLGLAGLLLSQLAIAGAWTDAKAGTVANLLLLLPVLAGALEARPSAYGHRYQAMAAKALAPRSSVPAPLLREADLKSLPPPVAAYLRYCGAVGKPKPRAFRAVFSGRFRRSLSADWMPFSSVQVNDLDKPLRAFLMDASLGGLPLQGFHLFKGGAASMQIKVAGLVQVVDARGPKMDQGETVTYLNDLCVMAPAALVEPGRFRWEALSASAVRVHYAPYGVSVSAELRFGPDGALVDFVSSDRFLSADGKDYRSLPWSTPILAYRQAQGRRLAERAELIWTLPEGPFCYGHFQLESMDYDPRGS